MVRKWKSIYADQMLEDIKRGPEKGPVSMETVDKRVRLDVDTGKAWLNEIEIMNDNSTI